MAPQSGIDKNTLFLWHCLQSSGSKIDFSAVATAMGLQLGAARMRYTRLKAKVESVIPAGAITKPITNARPRTGATTRLTCRKRKLHEAFEDSSEDEDHKDITHDLVVADNSTVSDGMAKYQVRGKKLKIDPAAFDSGSSRAGSSDHYKASSSGSDDDMETSDEEQPTKTTLTDTGNRTAPRLAAATPQYLQPNEQLVIPSGSTEGVKPAPLAKRSVTNVPETAQKPATTPKASTQRKRRQDTQPDIELADLRSGMMVPKLHIRPEKASEVNFRDAESEVWASPSRHSFLSTASSGGNALLDRDLERGAGAEYDANNDSHAQDSNPKAEQTEQFDTTMRYRWNLRRLMGWE